MGCYPLFVCRDWLKLHEDLTEIDSGLITLSLVTDPFGAFDHAYLAQHFQIFRPFKRHLIADLGKNIERFVSRHHRYYARKALREMQVEICEEPVRYVDEWTELYHHLIERHRITGIRAFSAGSFRELFQLPGIILVVGKAGGELVGGHVVAIHNNVAYSHLAAFSRSAYKYRVSYGLYWTTLQYLAERNIRFLDLGASAGIGETEEGGLGQFKAGWSNDSRTVFFCGRIFDNRRYVNLSRQKTVGVTDYFPAYRQGEFL